MKSERTSIKALDKADFQELITMYLEDDSNKYIPPLRNRTEEEYKEILKDKYKNNQIEVGFWTVRSLNNALIGTLNLYEYPPLGIIHIGLHLKRDYWNQGYGKELMRTLVDHGFQQKKLQEIHAIIDEEHLASRKLFEGLGFKVSNFFMEGKDRILIYKLKKGG